MYKKTVVVKNKTGLHARPAALFVQVAGNFNSLIWIQKDEKRVNAKSIMGIMSLGVSKGATITIIANGDDEVKAVETLAELLSSDSSDEVIG
ncbi:HPr family phosphocarrier protein [Caldanaerobius polysaccharolyticus]|uniref:HPr family phosphocarrier protein n=1 Tax=Caldanaerobius polysaccharolyticus TaxID=44256 RepID=UPI00047B7122|nr:HPr family phosphocarrier protein [Caldanaerobius polysaccharolyticus]